MASTAVGVERVAAGDGLLTNISLYHQGLSPLPHLAPIYPLWPLLLGGVGAVVGLHTAAVWLPVLFYLASLLVLYRLTVVIASRFGDPTLVRWRGQPILDAGHILVMLFGMNPIYFRFTSLPFTEGLGFTLAFARSLGEYGSIIFISGNIPLKTEITTVLIVGRLENYDYPGATALAFSMLVISFLLLFLINYLQARSRNRFET